MKDFSTSWLQVLVASGCNRNNKTFLWLLASPHQKQNTITFCECFFLIFLQWAFLTPKSRVTCRQMTHYSNSTAILVQSGSYTVVYEAQPVSLIYDMSPVFWADRTPLCVTAFLTLASLSVMMCRLSRSMSDSELMDNSSADMKWAVWQVTLWGSCSTCCTCRQACVQWLPSMTGCLPMMSTCL